MALPLSPNIAKAVDKLFSDRDRPEAIHLLTEQCGNNLINCENEDEYDLEDLRFGVLKMSKGSMEKLRDAVRLANEDWRDVYGLAGSIEKFKRELLDNELERNAKSEAVRNGGLWNLTWIIIIFVLVIVLLFLHVPVLYFLGAFLSIVAIYAGWLYFGPLSRINEKKK